MISGQVPKLIRDQFDWPSNVHGETGPKHFTCRVTPNSEYREMSGKKSSQGKLPQNFPNSCINRLFCITYINSLLMILHHLLLNVAYLCFTC